MWRFSLLIYIFPKLRRFIKSWVYPYIICFLAVSSQIYCINLFLRHLWYNIDRLGWHLTEYNQNGLFGIGSAMRTGQWRMSCWNVGRLRVLGINEEAGLSSPDLNKKRRLWVLSYTLVRHCIYPRWRPDSSNSFRDFKCRDIPGTDPLLYCKSHWGTA